MISELYHQNRAPHQHLNLEGLLVGVIKLDKRFHDWQNRLSPNLKVVRADDCTVLSERSFNGARVVLTLRYLSALLLLYRGVLTEYLAHVANGTRPDQPPSVHAVCQSYIKVCVDLAKEIIDLIADAKAAGTALPSWWFVLYYRWSLASPPRELCIADLTYFDSLPGSAGRLRHGRLLAFEHCRPRPVPV